MKPIRGLIVCAIVVYIGIGLIPELNKAIIYLTNPRESDRMVIWHKINSARFGFRILRLRTF